MARPKKKPADRRSHNPSVRFTPSEFREILRAAATKNTTRADWMRSTLLRAARRTQKGAK